MADENGIPQDYFDAEERSWQEWRETIDKYNKEWEEKWPGHCKACGGWGGSISYETHGFRDGRAEEFFNPCEALPPNYCHRCGKPGLDEDGNGPCKFCEWNYNDGMREY